MSRPVNSKHYFDKGLNGDSELSGVLPGQFINGQNIRFGSSDRGGNDRIESIGGTILIPETFNQQPTITVYDEDTEWNTSSLNIDIDFNNTNNPYHLLKSALIYGIESGSNTYFQFSNPAPIDPANYRFIEFYISLNLLININTGIQISLLNGSTLVSKSIYINQSAFGFFNSILPSNAYQKISIPMNALSATGEFDTIRFATIGGLFNFYIDYIQLIPIAYPAGQSYNIGSCEDEARSRIFSFNWNENGNNFISCLDKLSNNNYLVLLDSDVTGGLNFSKYSYIHSCFFINNNLYWVDGTNNQPRRFNTEAAIKAYQPNYNTSFIPYTFPISQSVVSWIRRQPGLPPSQVKQTFGSPPISTNFIQYGAFQFCYRYQYRDYELSTLSGYSNLANYNATGDTFNNIFVQIPFGENIDQDVLQVDLVVISLPDDTYSVIKSWNINITADLAAINAHNAGIEPLSYSFYNDSGGTVLDNSYKVKPFDSVPIYAETTERAKNRTFMGNGISGYNTPNITSLSAGFSVVNIPPTIPTTTVGLWYAFAIEPQGGGITSYYWVLQTTIPLLGTEPVASVYYYGYNSIVYTPGTSGPQPGLDVPPNFFPTTLISTQLQFAGSTLNQIYIATGLPPAPPGQPNITFLISNSHTTIVTLSVTSTITLLSKALKSNASYQISTTFYDFAGRKCGVVTNNSLIITIPDSGLIDHNYAQFLNWFLSNSNANNEIPIWASYYSVNITKCLRTRFFVQGFGYAVYATKDSDGNYLFNTSIYASSNAGIAIDLTYLTTFQMGYAFTIGDIAKVVLNGSEYSLAIIAQIGQYIICQLVDAGTLSKVSFTGTISNGVTGTVKGILNGISAGQGSGQTINGVVSGTTVTGTLSGIFYQIYNNGLSGTLSNVTSGAQGNFTGIISDFSTLTGGVFEIYTPYKKNSNEPYYEVSDIFQIANAATNNRQYSQTQGTIQGDISILLRTLTGNIFVTEAMSPNDKFWQNWNTNSGRPNEIDTIGQVLLEDTIPFSNELIDGTKTNGLSTYDALNVAEIPRENGSIQRLILAQKVEDKGTIMLCICQRETCSVYLGEVQVASNTGSTFIATSNGVIGTINALKGSFGTKHPESAFEYNGLVFWYDVINGGFVQYSNNGLDFISRFGNKKNSQLFSLALAPLTQIQIEQLGSRPFVIGGVDPYHKEATWTIPATTQTPAAGFLPDYGSPYVPNPYQLYDGSGGTWVFKFESNQWMGNRVFQAEGFCRSGNDLFSFKNGNIYRHNDPTLTNQNNFYGTYNPSMIAYLENSNPSVVKSYENSAIRGNTAPKWAHFMTLYPYTQASDLIFSDWRPREGVWYATILRDRLSPNISGLFDERVMTGDKMRGQSLLCALQFDANQEPLFVDFVNTGFLESIGHNNT